MADALAPPGSSQYSSNTMYVGDGTWDTSRNSFLLPNLVGLNFETMRYNGMGNRFKDLPGYHKLILGHGILAVITFLFIVPLAIFLAKYGRDWPGARVSFKLHVYLQIMTVFLSTVVLVLGWFAVGPERSLTNPHHGIGVAIYVMILLQFIYGSCMYRRERKRRTFPNKLPLTVWLHKLIGRSVALLAFVQVGLGLTLYGSPKVLFILYALQGFFLIFAYLALEYYNKPRVGGAPGPRSEPSEFYSDYGSYVSGSRTDVTQNRPPREREREGHHWGRNILAAGGAAGAYKWWKHKRDERKDERGERYDEHDEHDERYEDRQRPPPSMGRGNGGRPQSMGPPPGGRHQSQGPPRAGQYPSRDPPPRGQPAPSTGGPPPREGSQHRRSAPPPSQSRVSRESWEDEKYSEPPKSNWRNRILGAAGGFAAFQGAKSLFNRRKGRDDGYSDDGSYAPPPRGQRDEVSRTDVSRVQAGEAPMSPDTPRVNMAGVQPMTPSMTPSRAPKRPRPTGDMMSYDSRDSFEGQRPGRYGDETLWENVREFGPLGGFREWNQQRKERKDADRAEKIRSEELDNEQEYNRRNSNRYPTPQDATHGQQSMSGTLMTGPSALGPNGQSDVNRSNFRPDTSHPPLPAEAGTIPLRSQWQPASQNVTTEQGYSLPPPPPGPPPNVRHDGYSPPQFGSAQMPEGAVNPDPSRLVAENTAANELSAYGKDPTDRATAAAAAAGAAAGVAAAAASRDNETLSPIRAGNGRNRTHRRGSTTSGSVSQLNSGTAGPSGGENPNSPPVSVKVKMANDGRSVTLRRLNEEEAAADRAARRQERRSRRRRGSSLSSGVEDEPPPGQRYRRNGPIRPSNNQPITNIPPPPPMSSSAGASQRRESELNLPPPPPVPTHSVSPASHQGLSPAAAPVNESAVHSPGAYGTDAGTDISAFADNRKRRRAERARQAAAKGGGKQVDFEY
ncbi:hypothetical protein LTR37_014910 [Vermiconidia calcicola]|uniref:Uncharacterized protein n=1 Tax=Vermiconidia calcicola TaxID=1690605 RepID=A0ACC3MS94_9PEZI|nr:hypothetical protein LTR37_014910 [Vermiconidia calcicola]